MSDHHSKHGDTDQQNHDDCQDCKRQRAQNDKWIQIYQKLQDVDKRTSTIKASIVSQKDFLQKSLHQLKTFDQKVEEVQHQNQQKHQTQFQALAYNLYADVIEKHNKDELQKENERLQFVLKNIRKQPQNITVRNQPRQQTIHKPQIQQPNPYKSFKVKQDQKSSILFGKNRESSRSELQKSQQLRDAQVQKSFEIFSTKSTFNMTKRKNFQKKDFQDLNLWLFDQRHEMLEKQLYQKSANPVEDNQIKSNPLSIKNKGIQRYVNTLKNSLRHEEKMLKKINLTKRQISFEKKIQNHSFYLSYGETNDSMVSNKLMASPKTGLLQGSSKYSRFSNKRTNRQSFLPSISGK